MRLFGYLTMETVHVFNLCVQKFSINPIRGLFHFQWSANGNTVFVPK